MQYRKCRYRTCKHYNTLRAEAPRPTGGLLPWYDEELSRSQWLTINDIRRETYGANEG